MLAHRRRKRGELGAESGAREHVRNDMYMEKLGLCGVYCAEAVARPQGALRYA